MKKRKGNLPFKGTPEQEAKLMQVIEAIMKLQLVVLIDMILWLELVLKQLLKLIKSLEIL